MQEKSKSTVVIPTYYQQRNPSTFREMPKEDPLKNGLKNTKFNKWNDMMCLSNFYFFLEGNAKQWYISNEGNLNSWETFKTVLSTLLGDRQKYIRKADE
ncbi:CCHC-type domain-containing protein [Trichonephila clavata]|uniref:CCHC-type domain-containing protein n=1 Tax=Trichonephila clavata TaxID=2740835 RepID=A0A8X6GU30_TRICU|nr:CCHC-type domain-containing protein [Trichonephila clavata]